MPRLCQEFVCKFWNFLHRFNVLNPIPTDASSSVSSPSQRKSQMSIFSNRERQNALFLFEWNKIVPIHFQVFFLPLGLDKALDCFSASYPTPCGSFSTVIIIREPLPLAWLFSARVAPNVDVIFHVFMRGGGRILLLHHLDLPHPPASTFKGKYDKYACSLVRPLCLPASKTTLSDLQ